MVALGLLILAASCDTKNIGTTLMPSWFTATVTVPSPMYGGEPATWAVAWAGGTAPYSVQFTMGGGATPNTFTGTSNTTTLSQAFTMVNPSLTANANYNYTIVVTSANGLVATRTGAYTVLPTRNQEATITSATYAGGVVTVVVADANSDSVTVGATVATGGTIAVAPATRTSASPYAAVTFNVTALDPISGGAGTVTITATDGLTGHTPATQDVTGITIAAMPLNADTLYALPLANTAAVGSPVTIVVAMGTPANPFLYMNAVGVTFQGAVDGTGNLTAAGGQYVAYSFDIGAPDATQDNPTAAPVDGIWSAIGVTDGGTFLFGADSLVAKGTDIGGGRVRLDFNASTTVGSGTQGTPSGMLFNFKLTFGAAGTYSIGLQQFETVDRCFYSGADTVAHDWGHLMADATGTLDASVSGVNNTITVN